MRTMLITGAAFAVIIGAMITAVYFVAKPMPGDELDDWLAG